MKVVVELTPSEVRAAAQTGVERRIRAMQKQRAPRQSGIPDWKQNWWQSDIVGCLGEFAVCKAFGIDFVDTENDVNGADVFNYQVRSTENPDTGLRVRINDDAQDVFILALVYKNRVLIHGYSIGAQVKSRGKKEFENCWTLPSDELYSITDLPQPIEWSTSVYVHKSSVSV